MCNKQLHYDTGIHYLDTWIQNQFKKIPLRLYSIDGALNYEISKRIVNNLLKPRFPKNYLPIQCCNWEVQEY